MNNNMMAMVGNNQSFQKQDPRAIAMAESQKAMIQSAYIVAMQRPRNIDQARFRILKACQRPLFAEKVEYSKPVGGTAIKGPSIRFAELAIREWGNVRVETQTIYDDEITRRVKVIVIDLESNTSFGKEITFQKTEERRSKKGRKVISERINSWGDKIYIVKATEDEIQNKEGFFKAITIV